MLLNLLQPLRDAYAALPRVYWIVWLGTLVNKAGAVVLPFLTLYLTRVRGLPAAEAGLFLSVYGFGCILAGLTGGVLADRVGRRPTLLLSLFGGAAALLGIGLSRSLPALGLSTFLMGWVGEMYRPAVSAVVADLVPAAARTRAYGYLYWVINLGFALSAAIGGLCASYSYLLLFVLDAVTMAAYGVIVFLRVPETRPAAAAASGGGDRRGLLHVLGDGPFLCFTALTFGFALVMWQSGCSTPLDMAQKGLSAGVYGAVSALNGVIIVLLQPRMTGWLARRPRAWVMATSAVVFGSGFGIFGFSATWVGFALGVSVWTLGEIAHLPTANTVVADLAAPALRGRYQGVYSMTWGAASMVAPIVGGAMLDGPGARALWLGCAALMLLVGAGYLALGRILLSRGAAHQATTT